MTQYDRMHRGIAYTVQARGVRRWCWEITPPASVQGLRRESGEIDGELEDACMAAQSVIEHQTAQYTQ